MTSAPIICSDLWKCVGFSVPRTVIVVELFHFHKDKISSTVPGSREETAFATGRRQQQHIFTSILLTGGSTFLNFCVSE